VYKQIALLSVTKRFFVIYVIIVSTDY